jgi:hypothetical protein
MALRLLERLRAFVASDRERDAVWNLIPSWQYDGRHAESGGIARGEQEKALRDVDRKATEIDERMR